MASTHLYHHASQVVTAPLVSIVIQAPLAHWHTGTLSRAPWLPMLCFPIPLVQFYFRGCEVCSNSSSPSRCCELRAATIEHRGQPGYLHALHPYCLCSLLHWTNPRPVMLSSVKSTQLHGRWPIRGLQAVQPKRFYRGRMYSSSLSHARPFPLPSHLCVCVLGHFLAKVSFTEQARSFSIPADLLSTCQSP